ncbi:OLC1v1007885C1 [Oldenlandia corymbosa var. corymbosa]|uniref:OLC1v1007885C1 n=1 Tax=Oldenlandia corymbosa var. corymbosa TaxID=529605 RepID=A0AAV1DMR5_OLDCO|nr:OLC1v1007885C1 [Oldenlandia corymbosa var. corymbosa]
MYLFHNTIITFTISFVLVAFLVCVWRALDFLLLKPRKIEKQLRAQGLVGNPYRPVFGDLKQYIKMKNEANSRPMINLSDDILPRVSPFFLKTVKKYGTSSFVWFGPLPLVIIKDPKLMKEILQNHNLFHKALSPDSLDLMLAQGLFTAEGDRWAKHRKLINPAFHLEKIKLMLPAFRLCTMQMLAQWERSHSIGESCNIDVWPFLETLTSDAISRTAFGSNYEEGKQIFELQREQANHIMAVFQSLNFPGMRFLPTRRNRRMKEIEQLVDLKVRNIIEKRIKGRKLGEGNKDDLLSILVESNAREIAQHEGNQDFGLSIEDVIQECKLFYFAGQETLTTLLTWTLILLSKHQDWQTRARDEVLQVFGKEEIDFHGLSQLKVVCLSTN